MQKVFLEADLLLTVPQLQTHEPCWRLHLCSDASWALLWPILWVPWVSHWTIKRKIDMWLLLWHRHGFNKFVSLLQMEMDHHRVARSDSGSNSNSNSDEVRTFSFLQKYSTTKPPWSKCDCSSLSTFLQGHHCNHGCHGCHDCRHCHHFRTQFTATATASPVASHFTSANYYSSCYHHRRSHNHHCRSNHHHCRSNHHHRLWIESKSGALVHYNHFSALLCAIPPCLPHGSVILLRFWVDFLYFMEDVK